MFFFIHQVQVTSQGTYENRMFPLNIKHNVYYILML